jgi:endonuclease/exonuclease/phosphatase family metal-dependent hydrolase
MQRSLQTFADAINLLFFFQALLALVESGYSFGLLSTELPPESIAVLFLFSPALLGLARAAPRPWLALAMVGAAVGSRLAFPLAADPGLRLLFAGTSVSCWLILLVLLINDRTQRFVSTLSTSLSIALAALVALRVLGSGLDWSLGGAGQFVAWPLAGFSLIVLLRTRVEWEEPRTGVSVLSPAMGLMGCVALIVSVFSAPNVVARWGGFNYELTVGALIAGLLLQHVLETRFAWTRSAMLWANAALVALLTLTVLPQQIDFPSAQDSYPLYSGSRDWTLVPAVVLMLLGPTVLRTAGFFAMTIAQARTSLRSCAVGFTAASGLLLALFFAQILTITYDYFPLIGPLFRDRFWLVMAVLGLVPLIALWRCPAAALSPRPAALPEMMAVALLVAMTAAGLLVLRASPNALTATNGSLTVVTFNVQQGFLLDGGPGARKQLDALLELRPDVIGLQESDTNRISSGNQDVVRYFADRLDMYSYYGPSPVVGSFGVALLSRYPIESPRTFYLWSEGEQTAAISAQISVGERRFNVFVTHLGNGGPLVQQQNVLQEVAGHEDVLLLGDFNFRPGGEQYEATLAVLADSWGLNEGTPDGESIETRSDAIDHVFASPSTRVLSARYVDEGVFDHPIYVIEIAD